MSIREDIVINFAQLAYEHAANGDHKNAVDLFSKVIAVNPCDYRLFLNRSYCFYHLGLYEESLEDAEDALRLATNNQEAKTSKIIFRKAVALYGLNRLPEAKNAFSQVLVLTPNCQESLMHLNDINKILAQLEEDSANKTTNGLAMTSCKTPTTDEANDTSNGRIAESPTIQVGQCIQDLTTKLSITPPAEHPEDVSEPIISYAKNVNGMPKGLRVKQVIRPQAARLMAPLGVLAKAIAVAPDLFDTTKLLPDNLLKLKAVYVSNLNRSLKIGPTQSFFRKYGNVVRLAKLKTQTDDMQIVVEFDNEKSALDAMIDLRCRIFPDMTHDPLKPLKITLTASEEQKAEKFLNRREAMRIVNNDRSCFNWRSEGCFDQKCLYYHPRATFEIESHDFLVSEYKI